ncbi:MAG: HAD family phosphatase [Candidatus Eremiobacteraeota bacterium]|nr:HAD family phosphatase [Candidatus Eremiobacteraeota bacterium]
MQKNIRALIFDMDGLMIDSERLYFQTERELARSFGHAVQDGTLWDMMGRSPVESMGVFARDLGIGVPPEELAAMREQRMAENLKHDTKPMKGLHEIIGEFHGRLKLAVATGSPAVLVDIAMESLSVRQCFDLIQTSEGVKAGKPDPAIYLLTAERLAVDPGECIVLEDSSNGALAGKRAGCYLIAVPSEYTALQDFSFADYRAESLLDARDHIRDLLRAVVRKGRSHGIVMI